MKTMRLTAFDLKQDSLIAVSRTEVGKDKWDAFVASCDEAWLWHRFDLQDALSTWPGKHDLSFAILDATCGEVVAVVPLHLNDHRIKSIFPFKMLDSTGGPACADNLGEKRRRKILDFVQDIFLNIARQIGAIEINLALPPMAPAFRGERCPRINPLLALGYDNTLTQTWVVDLRGGKEHVWMNMEKRARTAIRKAEKMGVHVRRSKGLEDLDIYYDLHCRTYHRTGVRPHPKRYFEAIWKDFVLQGLAQVYFAEHEGAAIAAENFGFFKSAAIYWTGAASEKGLALQANSLIQWTAMQEMLANDIHWYETGEAFPGIREGKLRGLNDFKRSFGGELYPFYRGRIVLKYIMSVLVRWPRR